MRRLALLILIFEMLFVQDAGLVAAAEKENRPALVRVRSENPSIENLIRDATGLSTTFRGLIETIAATDGLVYVDEGTCGHSVRACLVLSVKVAGPFRLLRVLVNSRGKTDCALMASIGHELQHAIEVLRDPHVTDMHSLRILRSRGADRRRPIRNRGSHSRRIRCRPRSVRPREGPIATSSRDSRITVPRPLARRRGRSTAFMRSASRAPENRLGHCWHP